MQSPKQQLVDALRTEKQTIAERITDGILANVAGSYNEISRASIVAMGAGLINSIAQALETEQFEKLGAYAGELGQQRANAKVELKDVVVAAQITRQQVWDKME
ncbi:hypothetical protein SE17_37195, partial [Kouleothrix aurantiaca]